MMGAKFWSCGAWTLAGFLALAARGDPAAAVKKPNWDEPFPGVVQDEKNVRGFVGDYRWLSNFFPCRVEFGAIIYASSEAAYQASKFPAAERPSLPGSIPIRPRSSPGPRSSTLPGGTHTGSR